MEIRTFKIDFAKYTIEELTKYHQDLIGQAEDAWEAGNNDEYYILINKAYAIANYFNDIKKNGGIR